MTKRKILTGALLFFMAFIFVIGANLFVTDTTKAEVAAVYQPGTINIAVKQNNGAAIAATNTNIMIGEEQVAQYPWETARYLEISAGDAVQKSEDDKYDYSIEIQYKQAYPDTLVSQGQTFAPDSSQINTFTGSQVAFEDIKTTFYIDETEGQEKHGYGWGIYKIVLTVNTNNKYESNLIYIAPTEINNIPVISMEETSSSTLLTAWNFTITNCSDYVDQSLIRWFVKGDVNGKKYAYHKDDIGMADFPEAEYKNWIYNAIEDRQTGSKTFKLDTNGISGDWTVYCLVFKETPTAETIKSEELIKFDSRDNPQNGLFNVENRTPIKRDYIIWIIVAVAVVLVGLLVFVIIRSVKKEKVW